MDYKVIDGGFSSELANRGFDINNDPLWSARLIATNPDEVKAVHRSFLINGADVIVTGTYHASIWGFRTHLGVSESEAKELMRKGVRLAVEARDEFWEEFKKSGKDKERSLPLVAASLGPRAIYYFDASEYTGDYVANDSKQVLMDWHRQHLELVADAGADILAFETIPALAEAEAIVELLKDFPTVKTWVSFACKDGEHVSHGEKFAEVAKVIAAAPSVFAVGVNCSHPRYVEDLLRNARGQIGDSKILIAYPNSGEVWAEEDSSWLSNPDAKKVSEYVSTWIDAGAKWIGGCCRVTAEDVGDIKKAMVEKVSKT